jgi:hypothetical protein
MGSLPLSEPYFWVEDNFPPLWIHVKKKSLEILQLSHNEKDVENTYRQVIREEVPHASLTSPHGTDGLAVWDSKDIPPTTVRLLLEMKYDRDFKDRTQVCGVLGQLIAYLKKFEKAGEVLPNVLFAGDKNECLVLSTSVVQNFLSLPINWNFAPSTGSPELTRALVSGLNVLPYVYDVDGTLKFSDVIRKIELLAAGQVHSVKATINNISAIFQYWVERVFKDKDLSSVEQVDVFLRCLFKPSEVYCHPNKKNTLVVPGYENGVKIDRDQYRSFFEHFQQGYKPSDIEHFYANKDRLVEDTARRRQGAFFTPQIWVDEAHKMITGVLGDKWRDECIVWDPAAGTANLTRDYVFSDLIISTAEKPDVQVIKDQEYNVGASIFQYDFLNPGEPSPFFLDEGQDKNLLPDSVDAQLRAAAVAGKRIVFFMNPPYGTAGDLNNKKDKKAGIAVNIVHKKMESEKIGYSCRQQLYVQFMFQCRELAFKYGFKNITIAAFTKPNFMCSASFAEFRRHWYKNLTYKAGMLFQASQFADVSGAWGISFTVWSADDGKSSVTDLQSDLKIILKDIDPYKYEVESAGEKIFSASENRQASKWVYPTLKYQKANFLDSPKFSTGLNVWETFKGEPVYDAGVDPTGLFVFVNASNNLQQSAINVFLFPGMSSAYGSCAHNVYPGDHFRKVTALYSVRKLIDGNWINDKDEYLIPDVSHADYDQWVNDCHVFSLIEGSNNCTSMREVNYKGSKFRIKNHMFWKTRLEMLPLLDTAATSALYKDCKNEPMTNPTGVANGDPYLATVLADPAFRSSLSPQALRVLELLDALLIKSLPVREAFADSKPELHLNTWDAGLYQLKHLWRELFKAEWKELQLACKALKAHLAPGVYKFGFLK